MSDLLGVAIPGTELLIDLPELWRVSVPNGLLLAAVEEPRGGFATNVTVVADPTQTAPAEENVAALLASLALPVLIDAATWKRGSELLGIDLLVCHLVESASVTARQRQLSNPGGVLVITVSGATEQWPEVAALADRMIESVRLAS